MREIKFRAWNEYEKIMTEPFGLDSINGYEGYCRGEVEIFYEVGDQEIKSFQIITPNYTPTGGTGWLFLQYTGLKDKNGVEIYEGDIVRYDYYYIDEEDVESMISVVEFRFGKFWPRERYSSCPNDYYVERLFNFEVIGNIYENKELLDEC